MIKRYEAGIVCENPYGPLVRFEDHEKALVPLTAEIHCLRAANKALDQEYEARRLERDKAIADKRELVEMLKRCADPCTEIDYEALESLIAKHKEG